MSFAAPVAQTPSNGTSYTFTEQPLEVEIVNAVRTGKAVVTYNVEVASDPAFSTIAFTRKGIAEEPDGTTALTLPALPGNTTYYWRWRAVVDGVVGESSAAQSFFVRPRLTIEAPALLTPASGTVFASRPTFTVANAARVSQAEGPVAIIYDFQVSSSASFDAVIASASVQEQPTNTSWTASVDLPAGTLFWRARGRDEALAVEGPFANAASFAHGVVTIGEPSLQQPASNSELFAARPTFSVGNASRNAPAGTILSYEFQVSTSAAFGSLVASGTVQETPNSTSWTPNADLPDGTFFWRVRAVQSSLGAAGAFSSTGTFSRKFGIDLASVNYGLYPNVSRWPQTATISSTSKNRDTICTFYDASWPQVPFLGNPDDGFVVGNQWVFVNVDGAWHGAAGHWLRPGQFCKGEYDENFFREGFNGRQPWVNVELHPGDVFGMLVSTPARFYPSDRTLDVRSNLVMMVW